jgi:hypothetical protein
MHKAMNEMRRRGLRGEKEKGKGKEKESARSGGKTKNEVKYGKRRERRGGDE